MIKILIALLLTGILFGAGPCLVSCGPIVMSYIFSTEKGKNKSFFVYLFFSFGRILAYLVLSVLVYLLGNFTVEGMMGGWAGYVRIIAGAFIVCIGILVLLGKHSRKSRLGCMYSSYIEKDKKGTFLLGVAIGFLPCAPLMALFSYMGLVARSLTQSVLYGLTFGIGTLLSPLLLLAFISGALNKYISRKDTRVRRVFDLLSGGVLVYLGLQLLIGT